MNCLRKSQRFLLRCCKSNAGQPWPRQEPIYRYYPHTNQHRSAIGRRAPAVMLPPPLPRHYSTAVQTEIVPFTNRTHLVGLTPRDEREQGERHFNSAKEELVSLIRHPLHPDTVRVNRIAAELVRAIHVGLAIRGRRTGGEAAQPQLGHLDGLNWEVVVPDDGDVNAGALPGGKIIVSLDLVQNMTDAEIATVLAHEGAHIVARHAAEDVAYTYTYSKWFHVLVRQRCSRMMELEADRIGILLLGASGFDPSIAPKAYQKLGCIGRSFGLFNFFTTHPTCKRRSHLLSRPTVMEEALELYREVSASSQCHEEVSST